MYYRTMTVRTAALLFATGLAASANAQQQPAKLGAPLPDTPLTHLKGRWTGAGVATLANGREEPFTCIATYFQDSTGSELKQNLRCESPNITVATAAQMQIKGEVVTGVWQEKNYEQSGQIAGKLTPGGLMATVTHNARQATIEVAATACEQTVTVATRPGEMVRSIQANLKRC